MDVCLLAGDTPPFFLPAQELLCRYGIAVPDWCLKGCGAFKRKVRNWDELPQTLPTREEHRPWLDQLPINGKCVIQPPSLDYTFQRDAVRFPAVAGAFQVQVPTG